MQIASFFYLLLLALVVFFSYFFVDQNFPLYNSLIQQLAGIDRTVKTAMYLGIIFGWFGLYAYILHLVRNTKIPTRRIWQLILLSGILLVSYPAFSFDIFNYIATAKVTFFYRENPYVVMPIELSNEPLLSFMHAANKTALYGPSWIILTIFPFLVGMNNLYLTIFTFKIFNFLFFLATSYLLLKLSKNNYFTLALFALNPLVVIETLVSGHNDIVMMFFALLAFLFLKKKLFIFSIVIMIISVLIKFATLLIVPVFAYAFIQTIKNKKINWDRLWWYCFIGMSIIFFLSPLREELYSWYFIWPFTFLVLTENRRFLKYIAIFLSIGLLLRFLPFIYTGGWGGITPLIKQIVTAGSICLGLATYSLVKKKYL